MNGHSFTLLLTCVAMALGAGAIGGAATAKQIPTWYAGLQKPSWNPPNRVFAPVWIVLYILMAIAQWLVWTKEGFTHSMLWFWLYTLQLGLNVLWSLLFFGIRRPDLAFFEVILLWVSILATLLCFWKLNPVAGALFIPYLLWVTFASGLNAAVWRLNRGHRNSPVTG